MNRRRDLAYLVLGAVVSAAAALLVPPAWLSLLLLAPLAFFLTGYAILAAAFAGRAQPWPRKLWLSLGLSLSVLALLSLPLNYLGGLTPGSWAIGLVATVVIACLVAARRRPADAPDPGSAAPRLPRPSPLSAALGLLAIGLVVAAMVIAHTPQSNGKVLGFTELSLQPVDEGAQVRIAVGNEEQHFTAYRLRATFSGGRIVRREISLEPGQSTTLDLDVRPLPTADRPAFVEVVLYRPGETGEPYRRVYGWIPTRAQE